MSRTYVISDLHGRLDILEAALSAIEARSEGGTVVFTGDYVDRGPASRQVIERLMAGPTKPGWRWVCLKGNHEDMMVGALRGSYERAWWLGNGGAQTLQSYEGVVPVAVENWLAELPLYHADGQRIFVHAGVDPDVPMSEQTEETLLWSRVPTYRDYCHPEGFVVHGHTPIEGGPILLQGRANLDVGAVFTGRLWIAAFDDAVAGRPVQLFEVEAAA